MSEYVYAKDMSEGDRFATGGEDWEVQSKSVEANGQIEVMARKLGTGYVEHRFYFDPKHQVYMILSAAQWQQDKDTWKMRIGDDEYDAVLQTRYERGLGL